MQDCNPVKTPALKAQQVKTDSEEDDTDFPYREAIGSLLYVANSCRPDITQATHHAARFVSHPTSEHVHAVKRILRYLKGTINIGIQYKESPTYILEGYADADFAGSLIDARSTTGFIFITNGPISWKSRRQQITALSTTEAEMNALAQASKEAIWLASMLTEMAILPTNYTVKINEDNAGCHALVHGQRTPARTRHLAARIGYVRDLIKFGFIDVIRCRTLDMLADPLTKPLGHVDFKRKTAILLTPTADTDAGYLLTTDTDDETKEDETTLNPDDNQAIDEESGHAIFGTQSLEGEC